MGDTTESTDLTELSEFVGPAGTGAANAQVGLREGASARAGLGCSSVVTLGLQNRQVLRDPGRGPVGCSAFARCPFPFTSFTCSSGGPCLQPFQVHIDKQALLVMDFHAHLRCAPAAVTCRCHLAVGSCWGADARLPSRH